MRDDFDIEEVLRSDSGVPSSRVKEAVLAAFNSEFKGKGYYGRPVAFWKKPVPLYAAAASLVVLMGLSYFAGKMTIRRSSRPMTLKELTQKEDIIEAKDITWRITRRDLL